MRARPTAVLFVILLAYVAVAVGYAVYTPLWQAPDEPAHYNYVRFLVERRALPVLKAGDYDFDYLERIKSAHFPADMPVDPIRYESHQPPLYYVVASVIAAPLPEASRPLGLRLFSVFLGCCLLLVVYRVVARIFPDRPAWTLGAVGFMAFLPMHVAQTAAISNDTFAELVLALTLGVLLARLDGNAGLIVDLRLGALLGLCLLTKTTTYVALPLVAVVLLAQPWLRRRRSGHRAGFSRCLLSVAIVLGVAILIALPWFLRNASVYGGTDILGLARHDSIMTLQPHTADWLSRMGWGGLAGAFLSTTFHSFWGQFGWMGVLLDSRIYLMLGLLSVLAAVGLLLFVATEWRRLPVRQRAALAVMALLVVLNLASYLWYNVQFVQHQGRYLFPALLPLAVFFAIGLWMLTGFVAGRTSDGETSEVPGNVGSLVATGLYTLVFAALWLLDIVCLALFIVPQLAR